MLGVLATAALVGAIGCHAPPAPSNARAGCPDDDAPDSDVLLCDDFEDGGFEARWDIGGHQGAWPISQFVLCDADNFGFHDRCAAWSNHLLFDREWGFYGYDARRAFAPQSDFYVRWYQHISQPYTWGPLEDKSVMLHDRSNTLVAYVGTNRNHLPVEPNSGPGMPFVANYQDLDWPETGDKYTRVNRFQNQGRNITLELGKWYLFEWHIRLNTPGSSNGLTRLWIDDASRPVHGQTLRMEHADMRWLRNRDAGRQFGVLRLTVYDQRCDSTPNTCPPNGPSILFQSHRWDRIVVSRAPVGPVTASWSADR